MDMEPFDKDPLSDQELDELLPEWKAPAAPARLKAAIFPERRRWWRQLWSASIRLPLPAAACLALALVGVAMWQSMRAPRVVIQTRTVEVPVVRDREVVVTREAPAPTPVPASPRLLAPCGGTAAESGARADGNWVNRGSCWQWPRWRSNRSSSTIPHP